MNLVFHLAIADFKLIFRDGSLRAFFIFPIVLFIVFYWLLPFVIQAYPAVASYQTIILSMGVLTSTQMFNFISSMMLIDEKETNVASVYGVVPIAKWQYLLSRFLFPYSITVLVTALLLQIQPFYSISIWDTIIISTLNAMLVPIYVMVMNIFSKNRIQGMVYIKALNLVILIPVLSYFTPQSIQHVFGILPTHWVFQCINQAAFGEPIIGLAGIGFALFTLLLVLVSKSFMSKHFV